MSNITGDGGESFSSENNTGGEEVQQRHGLPFQGTSSSSITNGSTAEPTPPVKKKRNLPGTPDPSAEVIALSPTTLMATNRFVCEICNKGFQRDQNLQLHRRGHNLPWKLRQRTSAEVRRRVYICPEASCVHHNPTRALGDLTGIKKHFCRKHGEKKWKCDKCLKKYAVKSDWKAHSKTCGSREYKCDCGTIFSRRDSFITHRAFCDALAAEEIDKANHQGGLLSSTVMNPNIPELNIPISGGGHANSNSISISDFNHHHHLDSKYALKPDAVLSSSQLAPPSALFSSPHSLLSASLHLSNATGADGRGMGFDALAKAHMSATALLQKAAQMGATASRGSSAGVDGGSSIPVMMAGTDMRSYGSGYGDGGMGEDGGGYHGVSQYFEGTNVSPMNDGGMCLKSLEQESSSTTGSMMHKRKLIDSARGLHLGVRFGSRGEDTTTVDFLGVGGARPPPSASLQGVTQQQQGLQQFQQQQQLNRSQGGMEKYMWGDV